MERSSRWRVSTLGVAGRDGVVELVEALTTTFAGMAATAILISKGG
jgi:hypothetical protein